jgi:hypothetical protein
MNQKSLWCQYTNIQTEFFLTPHTITVSTEEKEEIIIITINFKLRLGFHPVAVALKRHTNKKYYIQNTDNIHIKYTKQQKKNKRYTSNINITQNTTHINQVISDKP